MSEPIYLDHNATTPVAPEVVDAMLPALRDGWGNPSSAHAFGQRARAAIDEAREEVARLIGCSAGEIVFTSGGTESDNMAIIGIAEALADRGKHLLISDIEHAAVERAVAWLERHGFDATRVGVDRDGRVDASRIEAALRPDTTLVSLMHANNETGVIQPVRALSSIVRPRGIVLHTDAAQSVGKVPIHVDQLGVDSLTIAGHKLYAPKGVGALYLRPGTPCECFLHGAGHEGGRRSGTENTPGIVGLGVACRLARESLAERARTMLTARERLAGALREGIPDAVIHGERVERLPNTLSIALPRAQGHELVARLHGVATAAGAACHSGKPKPSAVLSGMGVAEDLAICTLRLTVGKDTTTAQVDRAATEIVAAARALRGEACPAE